MAHGKNRREEGEKEAAAVGRKGSRVGRWVAWAGARFIGACGTEVVASFGGGNGVGTMAWKGGSDVREKKRGRGGVGPKMGRSGEKDRAEKERGS